MSDRGSDWAQRKNSTLRSVQSTSSTKFKKSLSPEESFFPNQEYHQSLIIFFHKAPRANLKNDPVLSV